jgi:Tfp pilus assembly PilM family ATPase
VPVSVRHASAALPAGALAPSLNSANIADRGAVVAAVRQVLEAVGRPRRVALALPDVVARLAVVRLDTVPARAEEREQLLRWHVRKAAPFDSEAAQVSASPGRRLEDGAQEFIVALARRDVIGEYEAVCAEASAHAGVVDLATSSLVHVAGLESRRQDGDWMLVHLGADYVTLAIVRDRIPIFFRTRGTETDGALADTVHQAAMYYEDRLAGQTLAAVVVVDPSDTEAALRTVEATVADRWRVGVERLDVSSIIQLADRIAMPPDVSARLAPAAGLVLREA